jgi:hypothetical protein
MEYTQSLIMRLLEDQGLRDSCLQTMLLLANRYGKFGWTTPKRVPGLWPLATFNLHTGSANLCCIKAISSARRILKIAPHYMQRPGRIVEYCISPLQSGASIPGSTNSDHDAFPLLEASRQGHRHVVELLLDRGA